MGGSFRGSGLWDFFHFNNAGLRCVLLQPQLGLSLAKLAGSQFFGEALIAVTCTGAPTRGGQIIDGKFSTSSCVQRASCSSVGWEGGTCGTIRTVCRPHC